MTTILVIFSIALILSLILSPQVRKLGIRFGALDLPEERKMHTRPIPRTGGLAIFLTFLLSLGISSLFMTRVSKQLIMDEQTALLLLGAAVCFGIGLVDDFRRLGPGLKFLFQIISASLAFWGGTSIGIVNIFGKVFYLGPLAYFMTVFWFVLFINAVNLVDGLDGLAGGIVFFVCVVMVILAVIKKDYLTGVLFAALGGSVLGFLRYNFNPASIFLGDGGSYFLGYAIAGLSITGSAKSQVGAAVLIPLLALGVPLFDTLLSPLRRFVRGKALFRPDNGHVHHRLIEMGFTTKKVVWFIYAVTFVLCGFAILMINIRDEQAGLFLILLGAGVILFIRQLGYFEYIASDKVYGWFKDLSDEAGFSHDRRSFLSLQIDIGRSEDIGELWQNVTLALKMLEFDMAEIKLISEIPSKIGLLKHWSWSREGFSSDEDLCKECLLRLDLPLMDSEENNLGTLWLIKDLQRDSISHYTLRRVEHLRRSVMGALSKLIKD
ncbi:glycosyltransferase family 4 protein [Thermodesulfobacteriota bacterium]